MIEEIRPLNQGQMTAWIKDLRRRISGHYQEIERMEGELRRYEQERFDIAPRGTYRHHRTDGSDITVDARVLETSGDTKYIHYQIPASLARRGEEDAYLCWLRTPEELARLALPSK